MPSQSWHLIFSVLLICTETLHNLSLTLHAHTGVHMPTFITVLLAREFFFFFLWRCDRSAVSKVQMKWLNVLSKMKAHRTTVEWNYGSMTAEQAAQWVMFLWTHVLSWRSCRWLGCMATWKTIKANQGWWESNRVWSFFTDEAQIKRQLAGIFNLCSVFESVRTLCHILELTRMPLLIQISFFVWLEVLGK